MINRAAVLTFLFAATCLGSACERTFLVDPAPGKSTFLALSLVASGSAGGPSQAFDKADAIGIQVRTENSVRLDTTVAVQAGGNDIPLTLEVPLGEASELFTISAEVRRASDVLFRGSAVVQLQVGPTDPVAVSLEPVTSALVLPATLGTLTAYGDSVRASGALIFATQDTVSLLPINNWTSLDPEVVVVQGGVPVARADGNARLIGQVGTLLDTTTVQVNAVVTSITIQSEQGPMGLGTTRQFTALLFDRRGNRINNRPVAWSAPNPQVLRIDASGLATAVGLGSTVVNATSGGAVAGLVVQVRALAPLVTTDTASAIGVREATLNATVNPNGLNTTVEFLFSPDSTMAEPQTSASVQVPAGQAPVSVSVPLSELASKTTYYFRAVARNQGGTTTGARRSFTTLTAPLTVVTGPAEEIRVSSARVTGEVTTGDDTAFVWVEWAGDSLMANAQRTATLAYPPSQVPLNLSVLLDSLAFDATYYYRFVATTRQGQPVYGQVRSFTTINPERSQPRVWREREPTLRE